ncbi:glycoside hydrolase family 43 protein [Nemania sp. NC0429]|nr:glycoside hydrolase family 43 protein [Nemania sp. NC0429]
MRWPYDDSKLTLTSGGTPDPFVNIFWGQYYLTFTAGDRIEIWSSNSLADMEATATKHHIWKPPQDSEHSAEIWAPELHALRGRWYIYFAAANPREGNKSHRMYVLGGPAATEDPCSGGGGGWEFLGPIRDMPDQWAIDGTVFELEDQLYLAYSGWPLEEGDETQGSMNMNPVDFRRGHGTQRRLGSSNSKRDKLRGNSNSTVAGGNTTTTTATTAAAGIPAPAPPPPPPPPPPGMVQHLFLVRLSDPSTAGSWPVAVSLPQQSWEITRDGAGAHAINEGPQWLASPDGRWRGLVYSCAGSWTHEYKMATLRYRGGEPLDPSSWQKSPAPLLQTRKRAGATTRSSSSSGPGPFGPGHGSFLDLGRGDVVAVYHATDAPDDGWENRRARVQRVAFTEKGPYMGKSFGVEGPFKRDGLVARMRAGMVEGMYRRYNKRRKERSAADEVEGFRAFLETRRLENGARTDEM